MLKKHNEQAHNKRVEAIASHLVSLIPESSKVLDVGCGDGLIASKLKCKVTGIDTIIPKKRYIKV